ncbi:MAG TPA: hypothetical protein VFG20_07430 [Planctomycetaceae bacterium]|nr:hypothetical protein [Planctomycetaceae bacterium]
MLQIAQDRLPQSLLSYVAFRVALKRTWNALAVPERVTRFYRDPDQPGYLAEVPFLRETSPAVQLEVLARTWKRHMQPDVVQADLLDEAVLYAACESTAACIELHPRTVTGSLHDGPLDLAVPVDVNLASDLRHLYLQMANDGDFLLVGQFLDMPPDDALDWKRKLGVAPESLELFFDVLSRWRARPEMLADLQGLITDAEQASLAEALEIVVAR